MTIDPQTSARLGRMILEGETQTRIGCFLIGIKQANAAVLSRVEFQPMAWEPFVLLHGQLCREIELIGLLQRVTEWSANPMVYARAAWSNVQYMNEMQFIRFFMAPFAMGGGLYRYLALTHALYAQLRFIPLLPVEMPLEHRFVSFLHTLETIHGRQIQTQISMLRNMPAALSPGEREATVGEESRRVQDVFHRFITELAGVG
jgi:hypothetical protein